MADLAAIAFFLLLLSAVGVAVVASYNRKVRDATTIRPWLLEEHPDGRESYIVSVNRVGDPPIIVGKISCNDEDFEGQLEMLRSEGRIKLVALNSNIERF